VCPPPSCRCLAYQDMLEEGRGQALLSQHLKISCYTPPKKL
jgi:hypothetical protein